MKDKRVFEHTKEGWAYEVIECEEPDCESTCTFCLLSIGDVDGHPVAYLLKEDGTAWSEGAGYHEECLLVEHKEVAHEGGR